MAIERLYRSVFHAAVLIEGPFHSKSSISINYELVHKCKYSTIG